MTSERQASKVLFQCDAVAKRYVQAYSHMQARTNTHTYVNLQFLPDTRCDELLAALNFEGFNKKRKEIFPTDIPYV